MADLEVQGQVPAAVLAVSMLPIASAVLALVVLATFSIFLGSVTELQSGSFTQDIIEFSFWHGILVPVISSLSLLLLFYCFDQIQYAVATIMILTATTGLYLTSHSTLVKCISPSSSHRLSLFLAVVTTFIWLFSENFIAHDILCCAVCVVSISSMRFPSLNVAQIFLAALLLYDVFWVFYSEQYFEKNVMVEVATKVSANPVHAAGQALGIPEAVLSRIKATMLLPIKLIMPTCLDGVSTRPLMIGLGDIVLPGMLISLSRRIDEKFSTQRMKDEDEKAERETTFNSYFRNSLYGYAVSLSVAFTATIYLRIAQPALIYLVPGTLLPLYLTACAKNQFGLIFKIDTSTVKERESNRQRYEEDLAESSVNTIL